MTWEENRMYVLEKLESLEDRLKLMESKQFDTYTDFVILKTKWGMEAAIISIAFTAIINLALWLLQR